MADMRNLKSVAEFSAGSPFSEGQLRWWIFRAVDNGLDECRAILRIQRRVYVDVDRFDAWIENQNKTSAHQEALLSVDVANVPRRERRDKLTPVAR
jgi:hypothetical protein